MSRPRRYIQEGGALVEITHKVTQGRYLLRPDREGLVNETAIGVLGRAQRLYSVSISAVSILSNHLHLLAFFEDADQMAKFMCHAGGNLSRKIGRLQGWEGPMWARRYRAIVVSDEEEAQIARLKYILAAGVKELLVDRVDEWPGVHSARALIEGTSLRGWWVDGTRAYAARRRGERPSRYEYGNEEFLLFDAIPCWRHLPPEEVRLRVAELVAEIEEEAAAERRATGRRSLGAEAVMATDPEYRPGKQEKSPAPMFHAWRDKVRKELREGYALAMASYCVAAEKLRAGDRMASFPEGTFPPRLPFVPYARGHPP